jgi:hypothetical protein
MSDDVLLTIREVKVNAYSYDSPQYLESQIRAACGEATFQPSSTPSDAKKFCAITDYSMLVEIIVPYDERVHDLIVRANDPKMSEPELATLNKQACALFGELLGRVIVSNPSVLKELYDHWMQKGFVDGVNMTRSRALASLGLCVEHGKVRTDDASRQFVVHDVEA